MWVKVQASQCPIFKCGSIEQSAESNKTICVEPNDGIQNPHIIDTCDDDYECTAVSWSSIDQVKNATCIPVETHSAVENTMRAGEFCSNTTQCFNHGNGANCTQQTSLGFCESPILEGGECQNDAGSPGHRYCSVGMYCKSKKCTKALTIDQTCTEDDLCQFGLACIATDNATFTNFTCTNYGQLENGAQFNIEHIVQEDDDWLGINSVCQSHSAVEVSTYIRECRPGNKNNVQIEGDLRQDGNDANCTFQSFDAAEANATHSVEKQENAKCGFNHASYAWCTKRKGDRWFVDTFEKIRDLDLTKFNCHPSSSFEECYSSTNEVDQELAWQFQRRLFEVDELTGFHLIADNDKCVSEAITRSYWQGRDPDSAHSITLYSSLVLVAISTIMIMF